MEGMKWRTRKEGTEGMPKIVDDLLSFTQLTAATGRREQGEHLSFASFDIAVSIIPSLDHGDSWVG